MTNVSEGDCGPETGLKEQEVGYLHWTPEMLLALARTVHEYKPFLETKDINGKTKDFKWGEVMTHLRNHPAFQHTLHHKVM